MLFIWSETFVCYLRANHGVPMAVVDGEEALSAGLPMHRSPAANNWSWC
jgi:hypothetical protein